MMTTAKLSAIYQHQETESTSLLGSPYKKDKAEFGRIPWRRFMDLGIGFALCLILAVFMNHEKHNANHTQPQLPQHVERQEAQHSHLRSEESHHKSKSSPYSSIPEEAKNITSQYKRFQAMGFEIYTGGAPALLLQETPAVAGDNQNAKTPTMIHNPECNGLSSYGHFDDYDITNSTLPSSLWQCYLGEADQAQDVRRRMKIMTDAVERAYEQANHSPDILKIFIAPEFFWRGREGAYVFDVNETRRERLKDMVDDKDKCTEVCQIMLGLEQLVSQKKYKDWLFLFGTVVVSETLPKEDAFDYLFYNFAPVYKGYDPELEDHYGKRFLVPKRYVSNVDFLTPVRQYNGTIAKELIDVTQEQLALSRQRLEQHQEETLEVKPKEGDEDPQVVVQNPFEMKRDFYDREMWYAYKDELNELGYIMIEYDWLILDNITFTMEVCLDHDARTALNAYLADNVMGSPTRVPKSIRRWDPVAHKYVGDVDYVRIPRHQAQLSLVSSMGMTANPESLALTQNGTLILQDGQSAGSGSMAFEWDCDSKSWHFKGGSEFISRTAAITDTRIDFKYQIHAPDHHASVYQKTKDEWKGVIQGVFTTTKYEPKITVYPIHHIAEV
ncbi:expressed unknown protein [Seminavis robusta]|uniref:Uncharacterized protein n=1 Tax=Seminavis robusta TaxID=568900 RepID=A0A9N8D6X7_9STRA|nr:expressed unknown protein [Seminavis robusta]|eukprot:Sro16_g011800.1 n/a (612) ;mRNA; f:113259-115201